MMWKVGDKAYCMHPITGTTPRLEKGRVYEVIALVDPDPWTGVCGLKLRGVDVPKGFKGLKAWRFVKAEEMRDAVSARGLL